MKLACLLLTVTWAISCRPVERVHHPASKHQEIEQAVYMFPKDSNNWTAVQRSLQDAYSARRHFDPFADDGKRPTEAVAMREALGSVGVILETTDEVLVFPDTGFISIKAHGESLAKVDKILTRALVIPPTQHTNGQ